MSHDNKLPVILLFGPRHWYDPLGDGLMGSFEVRRTSAATMLHTMVAASQPGLIVVHVDVTLDIRGTFPDLLILIVAESYMGDAEFLYAMGRGPMHFCTHRTQLASPLRSKHCCDLRLLAR